MSETDPFSDAAFLGRLQKLLPMLGSQQPGEADAARRKLIDHLGQHRLTLLDMAARLRDLPSGANPLSSSGGNAPSFTPPSFTQGAREISLERQLAIARHAKEEAAHEALVAGMRIRALEVELQQSTFEIARILQSQVHSRVAALAGWAAACILLFLWIGPSLLHLTPRHSPTELAARTGSVTMQPRADQDSTETLRILPGERRGEAAVQDLAIRLSPNDQATIRAFLNRGEPMAIQQRQRIGAQTWLLVRTTTGTGWALSGDVLQ